MQRGRIGELLGHIVSLSDHDIEEILQEQASTHRRFGEIALAWGLCRPEHLWSAWSQQLAGSPARIDLDQHGIDAQALALMPPKLAIELHAIPIRIAGETLIVACAADDLASVSARLADETARRIIMVSASAEQVQAALRRAYPNAAELH